MTIIHIVFFEWKPTTSHAQVEEVSVSPHNDVHVYADLIFVGL
jgi:hypothetical protein